MKIVREHINEAKGFIPLKYEPPYEGEYVVSMWETKFPKNTPKKIEGNLDCFRCNIDSFKGGPEYVSGHVYCSESKITSLEGAPKYVGKHFYCFNNKVSKEEVERYWKTGAVKGLIYTNWKNYRPL